MELSLAGLLGAMAGSLLGAINAVAIIGYANSWMHERQIAQGEENAALVRRSILAANIVICAAIGYWFGKSLGG
jgi:hypothetical protein